LARDPKDRYQTAYELATELAPKWRSSSIRSVGGDCIAATVYTAARS
jgi:hypothetical protein